MDTLEITKELNKLESFLVTYAFKLTSDRNSAKDLFQETAYRAIKHAKRCQPGTNAQAWLVTIMRNLFINDYRKKRRRATLQDGSKNSYLINASGETVSNEGENNMLFEDLIALIEDLDEHLKQPFVMTYQGYKYEEIAEKLNIPLGTVKSRIYFARKRMQQRLQVIYGLNAGIELFAA